MIRGTIKIKTSSSMEMIDVTSRINEDLAPHGVREGLLIVFNPHTTAAVTINEGADPDVQKDMTGALKKIVPSNYPYLHMEGNSPSHVMASLIGSSVSVFIENSQLKLGTWQRIFFCEFDGPRQRKLWWQVLSSLPGKI